MRRYELTNEEQERVKDLFPPERTGKKGCPGMDNQKMLWITRSGAQWREMPSHYGK